ncbi:MAG: hypothetical protein Harvfovirus21_16 [Harvfovirus sp.]|uniref:Uncharacterized protein n=1 Tax=Harvfovirus sp. TaxID=2487768 RepID=A0A3G5A6Y5_9VIRU|nr:MAG: hypothetical protein Harvfovirus21_16 [Harvfovirus sp.]
MFVIKIKDSGLNTERRNINDLCGRVFLSKVTDSAQNVVMRTNKLEDRKIEMEGEGENDVMFLVESDEEEEEEEEINPHRDDG